MKLMKRNLQKIYFCLYEGVKPIKSEDGWETGESVIQYSDPIPLRCNVSLDKGKAQLEYFGNDVSYDRTIVTDDMNCRMDENSVLFIDKSYETDTNGKPLFNYIVTKKAKGLNQMFFAVKKVL